MSKGSTRAHAKLARKMGANGKVPRSVRSSRARTRAAAQPRAGIAALALTGEDLDNLQWALDTAIRLQVIFVECPEVKAKCPVKECKTEFIAKPRTRHEVKLDDLADVAGILEHILGKVGEGATLHFASSTNNS